MTHLIAIDVGNATTKFRRAGGNWELEPSFVRTPDQTGYSFTDDTAPPRLLRYLEGPARITNTPFVLGYDAARHGVHD